MAHEAWWGAFGKALQEFTDEGSFGKQTGYFITRGGAGRGSSWHTDVAGPSQCVIWREWPSGAPGFQAPISKVPVDATAGVVPSRLLLHSVASCDFLEDVPVSFWSRWHADELRRGLGNSAGVVCLPLLGEAAG